MSVTLTMCLCVTLGAEPVMEALKKADALSCFTAWFCILMEKLVFPRDCYKPCMELQGF